MESKAKLLDFAMIQTDVDTLLALGRQAAHFNRTRRGKIEKEAARLISGGGETHVYIADMYNKRLRDRANTHWEKTYADRLYRKNVTIKEMAGLEWDELLVPAQLR